MELWLYEHLGCIQNCGVEELKASTKNKKVYE
jgi:hypothetical protein